MNIQNGLPDFISAVLGNVTSLYVQTAYNQVNNTASKISVIGTGKGVGNRTMPANYWYAGRMQFGLIAGTYQTPSVTPNNVTTAINIGGIDVASAAVLGSALSAGSSVNEVWGYFLITCQQAGTSGNSKFICDGVLNFQTSATVSLMVPISTSNLTGSATGVITTIDTTTALLSDVTATWGGAQNPQGTQIGTALLLGMN